MGYNSKGGQKYELRKRAKPINISMFLCRAHFLRGFSMSPPPATAGGWKKGSQLQILICHTIRKKKERSFFASYPTKKTFLEPWAHTFKAHEKKNTVFFLFSPWPLRESERPHAIEKSRITCTMHLLGFWLLPKKSLQIRTELLVQICQFLLFFSKDNGWKQHILARSFSI